MTFSDFVIKILLVIKSFIFPQDISEKCENQDDPPPAEVFLSRQIK
jgi:hypothetical protein